MHARCSSRHAPSSAAYVASLSHESAFTIAYGGTSPRNVFATAQDDPTAGRHTQTFKQHAQRSI